MRTRIIKYHGSYIPQYETSFLFFFDKEWNDFTYYDGEIGPLVRMFNNKEDAKNFLFSL